MMNFIRTLHEISALAMFFLLGWKTLLLLMGKRDALDRVDARTKVLNMIIGPLFLGTGIYLLVRIGFAGLGGWFHLKLTLLIPAIVLSLIGLKKRRSWMALTGVLLFVYVFVLSVTKSPTLMNKQAPAEVITDVMDPDYDALLHGKWLYAQKCASCHGNDGNLGLAGASALAEYPGSTEEIYELVHEGVGNMRAFASELTDQEIRAVAIYVKSL